MKNPTRLVLLAAFSLTLLGIGACTPELKVQSSVADPLPGEVINVQSLSYWPRWVLKALFWWQDLEDRFPLEHAVALYRVTYWSEAPSGKVSPASGLLALPSSDGAPLKGLVSWQHGTATLQAQASSRPDLYNGTFAAAIFAGAGYAMVAPDYPGFGASTEPHAYYHTHSIAASVVNLVRAARRILEEENRDVENSLFLTGFSQGGHASYAAHRWIEAERAFPWTLKATASIAGPLDLAGTGFPNALQGESRFASLYVAWIGLSYARVYGRPIAEVLKEPWASAVAGLFDGTKDGAPIIAALPKDPAALLTTPVHEALRQGESHWFLDRLRENSILDWSPQIPVCAYHGRKDVDVPTADIIAMAARGRAEDFAFEQFSLGDNNHDESILIAAPEVLRWFESIRDSTR